MAGLAALKTRLLEAEDALHGFMTGAREQEVQFDGNSVKYNITNLPELQAYINWLRTEISRAESPFKSRVFTIQTNRGLR